jgi:hypothetical protein
MRANPKKPPRARLFAYIFYMAGETFRKISGYLYIIALQLREKLKSRIAAKSSGKF